MAKRNDIEPDLLRQLLRYEPETGLLFWLPRREEHFAHLGELAAKYCAAWNTRNAGKQAFAANDSDYRRGTIFNKRVQAHRVIWAMCHDEWPHMDIDHINGDRSDNRLCNLRHVSHSENGRNQKVRRTNKSGMMGVYKDVRYGTWAARITYELSDIHLGSFPTQEEAIAARMAAEKVLKFHQNHGRTNQSC